MSTDNQDTSPSASTEKSFSTAKPNIMKKIGLWIIYSLAAIILILGIVISWGLGSQSGREWIANKAVGIANGGDSLEIRTVNIKSQSLGLWTLENIELYIDTKKTFTAQKFEIRWFPKKLFDRKIHIKALSVEKMDIYVNESEKKPKVKNESKPFSIPSLPYIELEKFEFPNVNIHREMPSVDIASANSSAQASLVQSLEKFTIGGNFLLPESQLLQLNLDANSTAKKPLVVNIKSTVSNNAEQQAQVKLVGSLNEDAGGDLASLLQFPRNQSLNIGIDATITPLGPNVLIDLKDFHFDIAAQTASKKSHKVKLTSLSEINTDNLTAVISELNLHVDDTKHSGYGSWNGKQVQASLTLNKFPLDIVSIWYEPITSGYVSGEFLANGIFDDGVLNDLKWSAKSEVNTRYKTVPITTRLTAQGNRKIFNVKTLNIQSDKTNITANGTVDIEGDTNALVFSIASLGTDLVKKLELPLPPSIPLEKADLTIIKASGKISGKLADPDAQATVRLKGKYENEAFDGESILEKKGNAITIKKMWLANNDTTSTVAGKVNIKTLSAELSASVDEFPIRLLALAGITLPESLSARMSSEMKFKGYLSPDKLVNAKILGKVSAHGVIDSIPFTLNASGSQSERVSKLEGLTISTFDQEVLNANGEYFEDRFTVKIVANKLPTKLLEALNLASVTGEFSANLSAEGNINSLDDTSDISGTIAYATEFSSIDEDDEEKTLRYTWTSNIETLAGETKQFPGSERRLNIASKITREGKNNGDINIALPLDTYLEALLKKKDIPSIALVDGQFDLTTLGFFLDPDLHRFSGKAETHLEISGQSRSPKLRGFFAITNGSYDNSITRSGLQKIECRLDAGQVDKSIIDLQSLQKQPLSFRVDSCTAKDSDSGSLALNGSILLPINTDVGSIDLGLKVHKMNIIQRADIESQLSGEVNLEGDFDEVWARGELDIAPLTATIDGNFGGNIPSIEVIDIEDLRNAKAEGEREDKGMFSVPTINLDLKIIADQKAYVRGRGLEAELYGEMGIKGILSNPKLTGEFNVRRGHFDIFNKRFDLEKGEVSFANEAIALDIEGVYKRSGEEIRAKLIGPSDQVEIKLSSIPKKPDDEILALLIFGKSVASITPFEAVRLAMAVQTLRGGSSAFDPIGSTRDLLGVDTITIDSQDENGNEGVNLGVGKYLNERVYLELQRTPDPSQPWKGNLEIELTPKINLESSAGGSTGIEGAEITWKHDY